MNMSRKAVRTAAGLMSRDPMQRIRSLELILSYSLHRLPDEERNAHFHIAPELTAGHLAHARLYPNRVAMLHALPEGGRVAEVGTWRGDFSKRIASICSPEEFHLIDIDFEPLDERGIRAQFSGSLHKHSGDSSTILRSFPLEHFDWIYVDGDHTYDGVRKDLDASHAVLKPGGYLMCNDYTNWDVGSAQPYGVAKAVNEFCLVHDYEVMGLALHGADYPDILLRKGAGSPPQPR